MKTTANVTTYCADSAMNTIGSFFKLLFFISVSLLTTGSAISQNAITDSLIKVAAKTTNDSAKVLLLIKISKAYENIDSVKAWDYYNDAKKLALKTGNEILVANTLELAGALSTKSNIANALRYYEQATNILSKWPNELAAIRSLGSIKNNLGVVHFLNGDYESALTYFMEAVKYLEAKDPDNYNIPIFYSNISTCYTNLGKWANAVENSKKALERALKAKQQFNIMAAYHSLGFCQIHNNEISDGLKNIKTAYGMALKLKDMYYQSLYHQTMADYYKTSNNYIQSIAENKEALEIINKLNYTYDIASIKTNIADCLLSLNKTSEAKAYILSAYKIAKSKQYKEMIKSVYELTSEAEKQTRNYQLALAYKDSAVSLGDSLYKAENIKRLEFEEAKYQSEKQQSRIVKLEKDKQLQQLTIRQNRLLNFILIGSFIILLLVGTLLVRNFRQKQQLHRQKIKELENEKQLLAVEAVLKGQEEERKRLAKDLHDGLGGMLSGIKYSFSSVKGNMVINEENALSFQRAMEMLDSSIIELRRVAHNMMPESLIKFGIDAALKDFCSDITNSGALKVIYQSFHLDDWQPEQTMSIAMYRIIQELVNNVIKHAEASEVIVQLVKNNNQLNIVVEDNGKGFDTGILKQSKGNGWGNIKSRVDYIKGNIEINSVTGQGTTVNIEIAL